MIDSNKNLTFWNNAAKTTINRTEFAGMLMEGREFEAIYRCRAEQKHFLQFCLLKKNMSVIEIGSGGGRWGFFFADKIKSYIGLDISHEMVKNAIIERDRRRLQNIEFICSDFLEFNSDEKFDIVYFSGVLQYMDDDVVLKSIKKASLLLKQDGIIISRDTIQTEKRVEKNSEYPVVYRLGKEYIELFKREHFNLQYSEISFPHKRFTNLSNRIYKLPFINYFIAYLFRELLCFFDNILGNPDFLKTKELISSLSDNNIQEHRFFKYVRIK